MLERRTIFSHCRRYRYTLWREWPAKAVNLDMFQEPPKEEFSLGNHSEFLQVIGLNPSTADEKTDDRTVRRCIDFAKDWGFGALCMTNLFAWRDTLPKNMMQERAPVGVDNDAWLKEISAAAGAVLCAWGNEGTHMARAHAVMQFLPAEKLYCLRMNAASKQPGHPLYISGDVRPKRLSEAAVLI